MEAQFSTPFLVAAALALGKVGIGEVAAVDDARVLALAARMQGAAREHVPEGWAEITVRRTDGRSATLVTRGTSGSPDLPLSDPQLQAKFRDCAAHAVRPLSAVTVEQMIEMIAHLEDVADTGELMRHLR